MSFRKSLLLSAAVFLSSLGLTVLAAPPGGHLNISQVLVDDPNDPTSITIVGTNFLFGPEAPTVTLGEYVDPLEIVGVPTNDTIVALLPANVVAGDYLLTVATGTGQSQNDEYDLTIGAVGPEGLKGDKGDKGDKGETGDRGPEGPVGPAGADGAPGQDGLNGANGLDGANCFDGIGDSVADCIGQKGDKGDTGPEGPRGPEGPQGPQGVPGSGHLEYTVTSNRDRYRRTRIAYEDVAALCSDGNGCTVRLVRWSGTASGWVSTGLANYVFWSRGPYWTISQTSTTAQGTDGDGLVQDIISGRCIFSDSDNTPSTAENPGDLTDTERDFELLSRPAGDLFTCSLVISD